MVYLTVVLAPLERMYVNRPVRETNLFKDFVMFSAQSLLLFGKVCMSS